MRSGQEVDTRQAFRRRAQANEVPQHATVAAAGVQDSFSGQGQEADPVQDVDQVTLARLVGEQVRGLPVVVA